MDGRRWLALLSVLALGGCSAHYVDATARARTLADEGDEVQALEALEKTATEVELDELLLLSDRGALLHRAGQWEQSAQVLNAAAKLADQRETVTLGDEFFGRAPWRMGTLERQALHTLNTLNYLQLGKTDSALVEARLTDALHIQARIEKEHREEVERAMALNAFDESFRRYFERLVVGRYLAGLAHEIDGNEDSAFIDYYDAWRISRTAPPGAPSSVEHLVPVLLRLARKLERPELPELERLYPSIATELPSEGMGEVVVVIETGRIPERFIAGGDGAKFWTVRARTWSRAVAQVEVADNITRAETVTSLENILVRRGTLGALADTERVPSLWVNTAIAASYFVVPPVGATLLIRRAYEVNVRMAQGWLSLPAEFQLARVRLPVGTHEVTVRAGDQLHHGTVEVSGKRPALWLLHVD